MTLRLKDVTSGYSQYKIRANFQAIQDFINEKALHRGATQGEANEMRTNLILSPTTIGGGTGSGEGVIGSEGDLCDIPIFPPVGGGGECTIAADIMLVIDNTGSQNKEDYELLVKPAIANMVQQWINLARDVSVGISIMRNDATPYLRDALTTDLSSIITSIGTIVPPSGSTDLGGAIDVAKVQLDANNREGYSGVIVIITDGSPNTPQPALDLGETAAASAIAAGYRVVVFGVVGIDNSDQEGGGIG
jgi:uncharacterized protein YegL